jgi:hypothetical protein
MSLSTAAATAPQMAAAGAAATTVINPLEMAIMSLNTNPYFIGVMMLMLNLGGRFLGMEVTKEQEKFFQNPWVRRALIFTVLFVATRNVVVAFIMTLFTLLFLSFLLNENSSLCLFKKCDVAKPPVVNPGISAGSPPGTPPPGLTPEEMEILRRLNEKQLRLSAAAGSSSSSSSSSGDEQDSKEEKPEDIYMMNVMRMRS